MRTKRGRSASFDTIDMLEEILQAHSLGGNVPDVNFDHLLVAPIETAVPTRSPTGPAELHSDGEETLESLGKKIDANDHEWIRKSIIDNDCLTPEVKESLSRKFGIDASDGTTKVFLSDCTGNDYWNKTFIASRKEYVPKKLVKATKPKCVVTPERKKSKRGGGRKYERVASLLVLVDSLFAGYRFYEGNGIDGPYAYQANWKDLEQAIHKKLYNKFCPGGRNSGSSDAI